jgi:hypothetical protein
MKSCWRYLNKFGGFFTIVKPLLDTALNIWIVFLFVWRIFSGPSPIFEITLNYSNATNIGEVPLPKLQTSRGLLALFEKIYYWDPIFTVISNNGEDVQYRCFN